MTAHGCLFFFSDLNRHVRNLRMYPGSGLFPFHYFLYKIEINRKRQSRSGEPPNVSSLGFCLGFKREARLASGSKTLPSRCANARRCQEPQIEKHARKTYRAGPDADPLLLMYIIPISVTYRFLLSQRWLKTVKGVEYHVTTVIYIQGMDGI